MEIKFIAMGLLILRLLAVTFLYFVLKRQWKLFRDTQTEYSTVRKVLFVLVIIAFLGNIVPIIIDVATVLSDVERGNPSTLGIAYGFSNAITAAVSAVGWWLLYKVIATEKIELDTARDKLTDENVSLTKDNKAMQKREDAHNND